MRRAASVVALAAAVVLLAGCGVPVDPDGTLDRVTGGELRVGVSPHEGFTEVAGGEPAGPEVEHVAQFAETLDAEPRWVVGGEEALVGGLETGELDLVIGGITDASPWSSQAGMTAPYREAPGPDGAVEKRVMLVPLGENGFVVELERFLREQG
jgi:polar amino acid transport system substrate-binding protein